MKLRLHEKNQAISLRKNGFSYKEICNIIPNLSKSTLSNWVKSIKLSDYQKARIKVKMIKAGNKGRLRGALQNKKNAQKRRRKINQKALGEYNNFKSRQLFFIGVVLYWAEGSKKNNRFQFINSDPEIIRIMMSFLKKIIKIEDEQVNIRLYIHKIYIDENCEQYWSKIINIPVSKFQKTVYKPTIHKFKKNLDYKGCLRIEIKGSEIFWKMMYWKQMIVKNMPSW